MTFNRTIGVPAYALASFALLGAAPATAGSYTYTTLIPPGQTSSAGNAINDTDQVAGNSGSGGFIWSAGTFTTVSVSGDTPAMLSAINNAGVAAGRTYKKKKTYIYTYTLGTGAVQKVLLPKKTDYLVAGISGSGTVVAWSSAVVHRAITYQSALISGTTLTPFSVPGGTNTEATAISPGGIVAGSVGISGVEGFTDNAGTFTTFPGPGGVGSININFIHDDGTYGGYFVDNSRGGDTLGFVTSGGTTTTYGYPNGGGIEAFTTVVGIDAAGDVAGTYLDQGGLQHGFIYTGGSYYNIDAPSATQTFVTGFNSHGSLVGYYRVGQGVEQAFIAQCPAGQSPCTQ
jgi:hypothetical protein